MKNLPRIYCDMDGVLCDFGAAIRKTTGMSKERWMRQDRKDMWQPVLDNTKFWHTMPWNPQGKVMWNYIKKFNPHILSAYLEKTYDPNCIPGKTFWVKSNLGINQTRINLVRRKDKQNYAMVAGEPAILIDDYEKNTSQFKQKGGIGITFRSAGQVISELKKLGF
jgi:phosphoglycolate phosphatase-like HAD superfamily hydrolase